MSLFSIVITLFLIMDPVGSITDFLKLIKKIPPQNQRWVLFREMFISLAIMIFFYYFGAYLLDILDVNLATVQIAGGIVLFLIAIRLIFPEEKELFSINDKIELFIVPIATPMIAGPSILATIMFYAYHETTSFTILTGICIAWVLSVSIFWLIFEFHYRINIKVLAALERLMGLILTLMAVEMFLKGLRLIILSQG